MRFQFTLPSHLPLVEGKGNWQSSEILIPYPSQHWYIDINNFKLTCICNVLQIDREIKVCATEEEVKVAEAGANLAIMKAEWLQKTKIAENQAAKNASIRDAEMDKVIKSMLEAFGENYNALHDYLMLDRGVYQQLGEINAGAIKGLQPKISVRTTGPSTDAAASGAAGAPIADLFKMLPPLYTTIKDQTGITPLPFLATLPQKQKW